jgi:hypothetical protein
MNKGRSISLSNKSNINVDHYKTKGRGRQGEGVVYDDYTRLRNQLKNRRPRGLSAKQLFARKRALRAARPTESRSASPQA